MLEVYVIWQMYIYIYTVKTRWSTNPELSWDFPFRLRETRGNAVPIPIPAQDDVTPFTFSFQPWWQRRGKIMGSPETCWDKIKSSISALWSEKPLPAWAVNKAAVNLELFRESPKRFNKSPLVSVFIPYCLAHELSHFLLLVNKHATLCHGFKFI